MATHKVSEYAVRGWLDVHTSANVLLIREDQQQRILHFAILNDVLELLARLW